MIFEQLYQQLKALGELITQLNDQQYTHKIAHLGKASIGGHTRHIIELLHCAISGYDSGKVDYINRKRNLALEIDRVLALQTIQAIGSKIKKGDKRLSLAVDEVAGSISSDVITTYYREVVYNTEHTIHHLALIKVALLEMDLDLVDENFGMAYSTLKFKANLIESI